MSMLSLMVSITARQSLYASAAILFEVRATTGFTDCRMVFWTLRVASLVGFEVGPGDLSKLLFRYNHPLARRPRQARWSRGDAQLPRKKIKSRSRRHSLGAKLTQLEAARLLRGPGCASRVEALLRSLHRCTFRDARSLLRFHDALLFLRAFPQSEAVASRADKLLAGVVEAVAHLRESGADLEPFESEQFSGVA